MIMISVCEVDRTLLLFLDKVSAFGFLEVNYKNKLYVVSLFMWIEVL
jgi:hypothetical protein